MTNILEHNNDVILLETVYPPEWSDWLESQALPTLFTNREVIENPEYKPEEWFNPFELSPQEIAKHRSYFSKAKDWKEYVIEFFPNLDPNEEYKIKRKENDAEKIKMCGKYYNISFNESNGGATPGRISCGLCDDCKKRKAKAIAEAWREVEQDNLRIITIPEENRAKVTRQLRGMDKQTYLIEKEDGSIECQIVVATDDESIGEEFDRYRFDYTQWANPVVGKRQSGNLVENNRNIVRGTTKEEQQAVVLDEGQILKAIIIPKFEEFPEGIKSQREAAQAAIDYAIAHTTDFAPKSVEEIQDYIKQREGLAIKAIREMGGVIYGIEYKYGSMHKVTEETAEKWLEYAKRPRKDKWKGIIQ